MPELPEVETVRRGIRKEVMNRHVTKVVVRDSRLRWPVPGDLANKIIGSEITDVTRRAKYLFLELESEGEAVMIHLGMSGSLRIVDKDVPPEKHDHVDIVLDDRRAIRYRDPRRFGSIHCVTGDREKHPLLGHLGPEPLGSDFDGSLLFRLSRKRKAPVKNFIMDSSIVVGVGNIYACESLFKAGVRPSRQAGRVSRARYDKLARSIKETLTNAIKEGGTTLRDFVSVQGQPGYFVQQLDVYGRENQPCVRCHDRVIKRHVIGQRSTFFCTGCQI